jgi:HEAT repeat protein
MLEPLLADVDPIARLASLGHTTGTGIVDLCFDSDSHVARAAFISWSLVGERGPGGGFERRLNLRDEPARRRILGRLVRSPHARVRQLAAQDAEFIDCFNADSPASRVCARWLLLRDPGLLEGRVREALASPDQGQRVRAVQLVRYLGWCERFEAELLDCVESARGPGDRATATAVAALGELQTPSSIAVVQSRLGDPDRRVRANAVEALARQSRGQGDLASACVSAYNALIELKSDPDHRVRANALRALLYRPLGVLEPKPGGGASRLYEPAAVESLAEMLADPRPGHRLAAAWLAGRVLPMDGRARLGKRFAELATRVGEAAAGDQDPDVRRRARQCVETLRSELRTAWGGRARKREKLMPEEAV